MAKKLKENPVTANIPIIFLTARDTENDTVTGFNLGADDYISKPFSIREVMVRIRAVLRRTAEQNGTAEEPTMIGYQGLLLNLDKKTVSIDGENVPFTKTEFELLRLLLEEKGRVFSRQELIDRVGGIYIISFRLKIETQYFTQVLLIVNDQNSFIFLFHLI
jgi:two-component system, OmpR family, alkaline phosphatase synthesis response regulator PhoP